MPALCESETKLVESPPPILNSARVVAFATVDNSVVHVRDDLLYVDGKPLGPVANLAICKYPHESEYHLMFCDDDWNVLGGIGLASSEAAKRRAEQEYRGIMARWQVFHHDDEAAVDQQCLEPLCSFCGKSFLKVEQMIEGKNAIICDACIRVLGNSLDDER